MLSYRADDQERTGELVRMCGAPYVTQAIGAPCATRARSVSA